MSQSSLDRVGAGAQHFPAEKWHRLSQFVRASWSRPNPVIDRRLQALVRNDAQWSLHARMPAYDRAHHLRVYDHLVAQGQTDADLLSAALLHDVGKADLIGHVRLVDRVAVVVLRFLAPSWLERLAQPNGMRLLHGLYLGQHHAELGADLAAAAGASARTCGLIARHECADDAADTALSALIAADESAGT